MLIQIKKSMFTRNCAKSMWLCHQKKHKSRGLQTMDVASREWGFLRCPAHSALREKELTYAFIPPTLPCKTLTAQPGYLLDLDLIWILGTWVHYPPVLLCGVITDFFRVIIIAITLLWIWIESALIKVERITKSPVLAHCYSSVPVSPVRLVMV